MNAPLKRACKSILRLSKIAMAFVDAKNFNIVAANPFFYLEAGIANNIVDQSIFNCIPELSEQKYANYIREVARSGRMKEGINSVIYLKNGTPDRKSLLFKSPVLRGEVSDKYIED